MTQAREVAEKMEEIDLNDEKFINPIKELIKLLGVDSESFDANLTLQMIQTSLKFLRDNHDISQLKLVTRALKEIRYAYSIFNKYSRSPCISIFGSARTPENHPDYQAAKEFSHIMASHDWSCITGAADGIMKAGHEGSSEEDAFGLSIKLPFETPLNSIIAGNPKLITFRYFFTRKLMFLSHSDAVAAFPGGFGTLDELFEVLTLMQTGKTNIIPLVLLEGHTGSYWKDWEKYVNEHLLENGWISPEDHKFYYMAASPEDAFSHIKHFYKVYHSNRYVKDDLVMRLKKPLNAKQIKELNSKFHLLCNEGDIHACGHYPEENDHLDLPRIAFKHTRKHFGLVRALIDQLNSY